MGFKIITAPRLRLYLEAGTLASVADKKKLKELEKLLGDKIPDDLTIFQVRELKDGEMPPDEDMPVFVCKRMGLELQLRTPLGQNRSGEGAKKWREFLVDCAKELVVGWENVIDVDTDKPANFDPEYLVNGVINPDIVASVVMHMYRQATVQKRGFRGNGLSASSRKRKPASGRRTRARGTAKTARRSAKRPT